MTAAMNSTLPISFSVYNSLENFVFSNALFSGGFLLGISAYLGSLLQIAFFAAIEKFKSLFFVQVTITSHNNQHEILLDYIEETRQKISNDSCFEAKLDSKNNLKFVLASDSRSSFTYVDGVTKKSGVIYVSRQSQSTATQQNFILQLTMYQFDKTFLLNFVRNAFDTFAKKNSTKVVLVMTDNNRWGFAATREKRSLDSIVLAKEVLQPIVNDVETFLSSGQWYAERGIPHRRGYLFYGKPGGGKSSLVFALASKFSLPIYILSLNSPWMNDASLASLLSSASEPCIILMEDIDAMFKNRDSSAKVTFSGLLNSLDGVAAAEKRLLFMTTNFPEKLDDALTRDGRIDVRVEFGYADCDQAKRMFEKFYSLKDDETKHALDFESKLLSVSQKSDILDLEISMAELQNHFLNNRKDPCKAIDNLPVFLQAKEKFKKLRANTVTERVEEKQQQKKKEDDNVKE